MKTRLAMLAVIFIVLAACGGEEATSTKAVPLFEEATPDVQATVDAAVQETQAAVQETQAAAVTDTPAPTNTLAPTDTPQPTETPKPTDTPEPAPTDTPRPTNTPKPTDEPEPTAEVPEPQTYEGSGDGILDIDWPAYPGVILISGNAAGRHFAVKSYDASGEYLDLLVNIGDPYVGVRPINFYSDELVTRLEINAEGPWSIEIFPLDAAKTLEVPGTIEGEGDDVILLVGGEPDLATVSGNDAGRHFAIWSHGDGRDLLVNTGDPYEGVVMIEPGAEVLDITAEGPWTISITER